MNPDALRDLLIAWSNINSGSENLPGLARMCAALRLEFSRIPGAALEEVELPDTTARALRVRIRPDAPIQILLSGHYDTVYGADHPFQQCTLVDDHTLRGPGVADMKGGLVVMFAALREFALRGIGQVALQRHQEGTEVKFYAVSGRRFFHWLYASSGGPDDGLPAPPRTTSRAVEFDTGALQQIAEEAAATLGLEVFGGDAIVGPTGEITLIDLNDWPSFAPCRERASSAIAAYIARRVDASWNPGLFSSANESAV